MTDDKLVLETLRALRVDLRETRTELVRMLGGLETRVRAVEESNHLRLGAETSRRRWGTAALGFMAAAVGAAVSRFMQIWS